MRKFIWTRSFVLALSAGLLVVLNALTSKPSFAQSASILGLVEDDPNNDPSWDWRADDTYTLYMPQDLGQPRYTTSPFLQGGTSIAVQDNDPSDGWLPVMRDFGRAALPPYLPRGQPIPHFILYNKFQGLLRIFVYITSPGTFTDGGIEVFHGTSTRTALLTFLAPRAAAPDQLQQVSQNRSVASTPIADGYWAFADFPIAYDPNLNQRGSDAPGCYAGRPNWSKARSRNACMPRRKKAPGEDREFRSGDYLDLFHDAGDALSLRHIEPFDSIKKSFVSFFNFPFNPAQL